MYPLGEQAVLAAWGGRVGMLRLGPSLAAASLDSLVEQPTAFPGIGMSWRTEVGGRDKYFDEPRQDLC